MAEIPIKQGDTFKLNMLYVTDSGAQVVGCEFSLAPRPSGAPAYTFDAAPEVIVIPGENRVNIQLTPTQTRELNAAYRYLYELTLDFANGERLTVAEGPIRLTREIVA